MDTLGGLRLKKWVFKIPRKSPGNSAYTNPGKTAGVTLTMKDNKNLDIRALQLVLHILIIKNKFQNLKVILSASDRQQLLLYYHY